MLSNPRRANNVLMTQNILFFEIPMRANFIWCQMLECSNFVNNQLFCQHKDIGSSPVPAEQTVSLCRKKQCFSKGQCVLISSGVKCKHASSWSIISCFVGIRTLVAPQSPQSKQCPYAAKNTVFRNSNACKFHLGSNARM